MKYYRFVWRGRQIENKYTSVDLRGRQGPASRVQIFHFHAVFGKKKKVSTPTLGENLNPILPNIIEVSQIKWQLVNFAQPILAMIAHSAVQLSAPRRIDGDILFIDASTMLDTTMVIGDAMFGYNC